MNQPVLQYHVRPSRFAYTQRTLAARAVFGLGVLYGFLGLGAAFVLAMITLSYRAVFEGAALRDFLAPMMIGGACAGVSAALLLAARLIRRRGRAGLFVAGGLVALGMVFCAFMGLAFLTGYVPGANAGIFLALVSAVGAWLHARALLKLFRVLHAEKELVMP